MNTPLALCFVFKSQSREYTVRLSLLRKTARGAIFFETTTAP